MGGATGTRRPHVALAVVASIALVVLLVAGRAADAVQRFPDVWLPALVILTLYLGARRFPLRLGRRNRLESTACTTFGFALLLAVPVPIAVMALAAAAVVPAPDGRIGDWRRRVFEVSRVAIVFAAAGVAIETVGATLGLAEPDVAWHYLVVLLPAGALAYALDATLCASYLASERGGGLRAVLTQDRERGDVLVYLLLVVLAPLVVTIAERALLLAPSLLIAAIALHRVAGSSASHQHGALHDALTGLPNRRQLELRLAELTANAAATGRTGLLLMDLDRFTAVNESLGHEVGDELLELVAERLRGIEDVDLVARIGGDEFAFIVRQVADTDGELLDLGERVLVEVHRPFTVRGVQVSVRATIGIAVHPDHGNDGPGLLRRADSAMYAAKRDGVPVGLAPADPSDLTPGRVSLIGELEDAMRRDELQLEYQPKVCLHGREVVGFESLLRWHHPVHGLIPPDVFVGTVEHTDLIAPLTRHVLRKALGDLQGWADAGHRDINVAVNISTRDLQDVRFPRELRGLLTDHDVAPASLTLEITETALQVDPERAAEVLAALRELGVRLSIDDFGTGYSSLAALRHLPVSELKIDRVFVAAMAEDDAGRAIVRSMVQLGHALGLDVVAEGVESEALVAELRSFGCDVVQGYVVGRPLDADLVTTWLEERRRDERTARTVPFARAVRELSRPKSSAKVG